jgi:hypothetical protein
MMLYDLKIRFQETHHFNDFDLVLGDIYEIELIPLNKDQVWLCSSTRKSLAFDDY